MYLSPPVPGGAGTGITAGQRHNDVFCPHLSPEGRGQVSEDRCPRRVRDDSGHMRDMSGKFADMSSLSIDCRGCRRHFILRDAAHDHADRTGHTLDVVAKSVIKPSNSASRAHASLDALNLPRDVGAPLARRALRDAGLKFSNGAIAEAVRRRKAAGSHS